MSTIKARKGNPFEYDTAYNLHRIGFKVTILGDNTKGVDIKATSALPHLSYYVECKFHKGFSWNEIKKIFNKTKNTVKGISDKYGKVPIVVFKANRQPILVAYEPIDGKIRVSEFSDYFKIEFEKRPKKWKIWENIDH